MRMRTATSKFVTVFDVCVVVASCLCGAITGLVGRKFMSKINYNLRKVYQFSFFLNTQLTENDLIFEKKNKNRPMMSCLYFLTIN